MENKEIRPDSLFKVKVVLAFVAIYFVWGSTFSMVSIALKAFSPLVLNTFRFLLGGLLLSVYCTIKRYSFPAFSELIKYVVLGIIIFMGGVVAVVWAQQYISSSLTSIIITTPFWFLVLDRPNWKNNFSSPFIITGIILGFTGVIVLMLNRHSISISSSMTVYTVPAILIIVLGSFLWAGGSLYLKYNPGTTSILVRTSIQLISVGLVCLSICLINGSLQKIRWDEVPADALLSILYLSIMSTTITFIAFIWLLQHRSPAIVSTYSYVNPLVAALLGSFLLHEKISFIQIIAMLIILSGVLLINFRSYRTLLKKSYLKFIPSSK